MSRYTLLDSLATNGLHNNRDGDDNSYRSRNMKVMDDDDNNEGDDDDGGDGNHDDNGDVLTVVMVITLINRIVTMEK